MKKGKKKPKTVLGKGWYFIWEDNSIWSWIVNIVLAFLLIKFVVYPGLGFLLGTSYPIVAVVSSSMEHNADFDSWWLASEKSYSNFNITKQDFLGFSLRNGFNRGDIIVLRRAEPENLKIGEIIVFESKRPEPVIHRIVKKLEKDNKVYFQTKGDNYKTNQNPLVEYVDINNNRVSRNSPGAIKIVDETEISEDELIGMAWFKIPLLGYIKIWFTELMNLVR
jgi:signal peptidase I